MTSVFISESVHWKGGGGHNHIATPPFSPCSSAAFRRKVPGLFWETRLIWTHVLKNKPAHHRHKCIFCARRRRLCVLACFRPVDLVYRHGDSSAPSPVGGTVMTSQPRPLPGIPVRRTAAGRDAVRTVKFAGSAGVVRKWRRSVPKLPTTDKMFNKLRSSCS